MSNNDNDNDNDRDDLQQSKNPQKIKSQEPVSDTIEMVFKSDIIFKHVLTRFLFLIAFGFLCDFIATRMVSNPAFSVVPADKITGLMYFIVLYPILLACDGSYLKSKNKLIQSKTSYILAVLWVCGFIACIVLIVALGA